MKESLICFAALLAVGAMTPTAQAGYPCMPQAPDACGPGFYSVNPYGMVYGPNYYLRPPWLPYQGAAGFLGAGGPGAGGPGAGGYGPGAFPPGYPGAGPPSFPTHPFARSPRDFFMYYD